MADINEVLPSLPVGLFQADRAGRVVAANAAFGALVQGMPGNAVGAPPWSNAHPGDRATAELAWRRATEGDDDVRLDFRVWHGEGHMCWVRIDASPVRDGMGRILGYAGTALDHTDDTQRKLLLDRLQGVVGSTDAANDGYKRHVFVQSVRLVNPSARRVL